jgi:plastocyanin
MSSKRAGLTAAIVAAAVLALVPSGALGGAHAAGGHVVTLSSKRFHPGALTINRGDSVTWQWTERKNKHNVTFSGFHSPTQKSGSYSVRFTHSGTFNYRCTIHEAEGMLGKIVVR